MKKIISFAFLFLFTTSLFSQENSYNLTISDFKPYIISNGLKSPDEVYVLKVSIYDDKYLLKNRKNNYKINNYLKKIKFFKNLRVIYIDGDLLDLTDFPIFIKENIEIEDIEVHRDKTLHWDDFFKVISSFKNFKYLEISESDDVNISDNILGLKNLTKFSIFKNRIKYFSNNFSKLESLKIFNYGNNYTNCLPKSVFENQSISELSISDQINFDFKNSFISLSNLKNLKIINLNNNNLEVLPEEIGLLLNLEEIYLGNNRLKDLPLSLTKLTKLKSIILTHGNNNLENISKEFMNTINLKRVENGNFISPSED